MARSSLHAAAAGLALLWPLSAEAAETISADLAGFNEVPALYSAGSGTFEGTLTATSLTYKLTYAKLTAPVTQAHIHLAQKSVNGNIMVFLCSNFSGAPAGTPPCPANGGTVSGSLTTASVLAIAAQNIPAGAFGRMKKAIETGVAYVNVHTSQFPAGEIRGQIQVAP